jgi:hypothetical protein
MIGLFLVVEVPHAGDKRIVPLTFGPINRFPLRRESAEHMIGMIFDNVIINRAPFRPAL